MALSQKNYVAVAAILKDEVEASRRIAKKSNPDSPFRLGFDDYDRGIQNGFLVVAERLAEYFEDDNPRFDRARFLAASGVKV